MQLKKTLFLFLLLIPSFLLGQVLKQVENSSTDLPDPEDYPFGFVISFGLPGGGLGYEIGNQNIRALYEKRGIEIPRTSPFNYYALGIRYRRFYVEASARSLLINPQGEDVDNGGYTVQSSQTIGNLNLGFSVWQNRNTAIVLRGGVGFGETTYAIRSNEEGSLVDFQDLASAESPDFLPLVTHANSFLDFGIEIWQGRPKRQNSLSEVARFGYRFGVDEKAWEVIGAPSTNAPIDRMGELYFHVSFNLGFNFKKKD